MHEWHRRTIAKLKNHFEVDSGFQALIVVGSVARSDAAADSDVDFIIHEDSVWN